MELGGKTYGVTIIMIQDNPELLEIMFADMQKADVLYRPTNYWSVYQKKLMPVLAKEGISRFRASDCKVFGSFGVSQTPLTLMAQWYRSDQHHTSMLERILFSLYEKKPAFALIMKQHRATLQAFREACFHFTLRGDQDHQLLSIGDSGLGDPQDLFTPNKITNNYYTLSFLRYYHHLQWVRQFVDFTAVRSVLELGCGYGGQIEVIRKLYPNIRLIVCDIPPQLYISEQYLKAVFPGEVTGYLETSRAEKIDWSNADAKPITIIPTWKLKNLVTPVDLFWSSATFQEMEPEVVENYLKIIQQLTRSFIYLLQIPTGKKKVQESGKLGVLEPTKLEHYIQFLPEFSLIELVDALFFASGLQGIQYFHASDLSHMLFKKGC